MTKESLSQEKAPVKALTVRLESLRARGLLAIVKRICAREGASVEEIFSERRSAHIARARRMVWWELRDRGWNYVEIAEFFGRDHSSVILAVARAEQELGLVAAPKTRRAA
ncbi:helix-turn-helix domain-containing protein [Sorangium sp. So ce1024]|uniref:helix-turn-helix domain-containing protein n=1 Tax=Sorangium sp. So ce1024 TaxID=3133327 RepID=UPI003F02E5B1